MTAAATNETKARRRKGVAGPLRKRILDAALEIMRTDGLKRLTQPKVAAAAGIRQSHLTYYFPKKVDLIVALLGDHVHGEERHGEEGHAAGEGQGPSTDQAHGHEGHHHHDPEHIGSALELVASDSRRISFFLNLIVEAEQEPALRRMVYVHMAAFDAVVARAYGRPADDPDVEAFVDSLRGFGMKQLLRDDAKTIDIDALAARFGLKRSRAPPAPTRSTARRSQRPSPYCRGRRRRNGRPSGCRGRARRSPPRPHHRHRGT